MTHHPLTDLLASTRDIMTLLEIVDERKSFIGRRRPVEVLNRSALVLLVACWEAFIEDLVLRCVKHFDADHCTPEMVPAVVRKNVSRRIRDDKHDNAPWNLAGDGWRRALVDYVESQVTRFNTPNSENVDELLQRCLGIERISSSWKLNGSANRARRRLNLLNRTRGTIAHRVSTGQSITVTIVDSYLSLIIELAVCTEGEVREHLKSCTGKEPWPRNRAA